MHETFEHTADLGLRIRAADLETLFAEAGEALMATVVENPQAIEPRQEVSFSVSGEEREYLLFDWLNALLYQFETEHQVFRSFHVVLTPQGLEATARGEPLDPQRHGLGHEVKAITYHGLTVQATPEGWRAEVIVDI
jgi:SHS2 domain-containing protein